MAKILEVQFKGGRKSFYGNAQEFPFVVGDMVIVQAEKGEDLGRVVNMGKLVDQRAGDKEYPQIIRKPAPKDRTTMDENQELEKKAFDDCRKRIEEHGLNMKLVDVEYQFDRNKITFYFTSEKRVDFRSLVRDLASKSRTRIELRQIGVRDEAKRIGGLGVCGRSLCCTTFLREFEPVVTQFAKEQNLALNPSKLSGACGRLMCCLLYERDFYQHVLEQFPEIDSKIKTPDGTAFLKKVDVFHEEAIITYASGTEAKLTLPELKIILEGGKHKKDKHKDWPEGSDNEDQDYKQENPGERQNEPRDEKRNEKRDERRDDGNRGRKNGLTDSKNRDKQKNRDHSKKRDKQKNDGKSQNPDQPQGRDETGKKGNGKNRDRRHKNRRFREKHDKRDRKKQDKQSNPKQENGKKQEPQN